MSDHAHNVEPVPGEPGRYMVQGRSLFCSGCKYRYRGERMVAGDRCPNCGERMEQQRYLVDVVLYDGIGRCGCDSWIFNLQPLINKLTPVQREIARENDSLRCPHGIAALRQFAMDKVDELNRGSNQTHRENNGE